MEIPAMRPHPRPSVQTQSYTCLGQEKHQMLDLNRRLESYLGRVMFLEEENQLLQEEILMLRRNREPQAQQRRALEAALMEAREELEQAWREKDKVEVQLGNLSEEIQAVGLQRQKVAAARAEAQGRLAEQRKELEEERRAQIWLRDKASQLENELHFQTQSHQDDLSALKATAAQTRPLQAAPSAYTQTHTQIFCDLGQQYSQKAAQAWREASEAYQRQAERLEESLGQAKARLGQITQERRENQMKLQSLAKELETARTKKEMLERRAAQQKDKQCQEISQMQAHVDTLEEEKNRLGGQIDDLIMESRTLLQLKMSLGLEVATYRTLLDGESRVNDPSRNKYTIQTVSSTDGFPSLQELKQTFQKAHSPSYTSTPSTSDIRSSLYKPTSLHKPLLSATSTLSTPHHIPSTALDHSPAVQEKRESRADAWSTPYTDTKALNGKDSVDHFMPEEVYEEVKYAAALSGASSALNSHAMGESFEADMAEEMPGVKVQAVTSDVLVPEENIVCAKMAYSTMAVYGSNVLQDVSTENVDECNSSVADDINTGDSCDTEGEKTDDFSEWIQPQHEQGSQPTWSKSDSVTNAERFAMTEEQNDASGPDRVNTGTTFNDLLVKEDATELTPEDSAHNEEISDGYRDLEENHGFHDPERENSINQSLSMEDMNMAHESDQSNALESKGQARKIAFEESNDDLPQQEEEIKETNVEEEQKAFEEEKHTMFTDSEIIEGLEGQRCTDTEQNHLPDRSFEEDVVAVTHNNVSMNLEEDPLATCQEQEETRQSEEHSELNEGFSESEQMDERRDYSESEEKELDDSPNVSMSWRTDPGELDSYSLDNTLADTRPLIRYKSDDTDVNTQASHMGISDSSDSEDDREAGTGPRGVIKSKRFDTMEDLSEEPEVEARGDMGSSEPPQNVVTDALSENHYMTLQEEYDDDADNENFIADTLGKLDEERTEMADHSKSDDVEADGGQDFEDPWRDDMEGQQDIIQEEKTEMPQANISPEDFPELIQDEENINNTQQDILPQNFPEETVESLPNNSQTEISEEEVVTDNASQDEITDNLPKPEDLTIQSSPFVEPFTLTQNVSGTLHEEAAIEIKPSMDSSMEDTMEKLVDAPHQTDLFFKEEVDIEAFSQEEITDELPIPEDPKTQPSPFIEPFALTDEIETSTEENIGDLFNNLPQTVTESISQEEEAESSAFVEPFALKTETQNIFCTSHEAAEFEIKPSIQNSMEKTNEEDWQDLSMLTHVDGTDNISLSSEPASRPDSQAQASNSDNDGNNNNDEDEDDDDGSHSSEEESPNASQCPSPGAFAKSPQAYPTLEEASENLSGAPDSSTLQGSLHEDEWEVLNTSSKSQDTDNPKESESKSFNPFGENYSLSTETYAKQTSEHVDIFQGDKTDEAPKSNGKDKLHNFFSSNMEDDDFWGSSQTMAATFDPEEINQEQYQSVTFQTSQSLRFEEDTWLSPRAPQGPNGRAEKTTLLSPVPLLVTEEGHSQIKTTLEREEEQVAATQSDDSVDEGDSWSSGEE